jgi:hypothetical protein
MFMTKPIMMMRIITTYAKVRILSLTIFFSHVILTQLTNNFLLKLLVFRLLDIKMNNINWKTFLYCFINDIILFEFF